MPPDIKRPGGWSAARKHLATWDKPALLALVKDLYDAAAGNRDFIHARCQAEDGGGEVLEAYRSKIVKQFFPKRGDTKLNLGAARKAIREYRKATGNIPGTAELLMSYVERTVRSFWLVSICLYAAYQLCLTLWLQLVIDFDYW